MFMNTIQISFFNIKRLFVFLLVYNNTKKGKQNDIWIYSRQHR